MTNNEITEAYFKALGWEYQECPIEGGLIGSAWFPPKAKVGHS